MAMALIAGPLRELPRIGHRYASTESRSVVVVKKGRKA